MSPVRYEDPYQLLLRSEMDPDRKAIREELFRATDVTGSEAIARILRADEGISRSVLELANLGVNPDETGFLEVDGFASRTDASLLRGLGLSFVLFDLFRRGNCPEFDYDAFWSRALAQAVAAHAIARELRAGTPAVAFASGFLARLGQVALAESSPEVYGEIVRLSAGGDVREMRWYELRLFGVDHHEISQDLLRDLGAPAVFVDALAGMDFPAELRGCGERGPLTLSGALHLAGCIADLLLAEPDDQRLHRDDLSALCRALDLDEQRFHLIGDSILSTWWDWGDRLRVPARPLPRFADLGRAPDAAGADLSDEEPAAESTLRVIAVDDDPVALKILESHLRAGGCDVRTARDGREALDKALEDPPDVVVADWIMPELNGIELCRSLRSYGLGRRIYFLLLTGRDEEEQAIEAFEAGVDDFVTKPFQPKVLMARIRPSRRVIELQRQVEIDKRLLREQAYELGDRARKLRAAAMTDALTDLPNRRYAIKRLHEEWESATRGVRPLSVLMIDIDRFKPINDDHGHDVGDLVLREAADRLRDSTRRGESACRLGGEEFLIICSDTDREEAEACAERIRRAFEDEEFRVGDLRARVTVSIGVAQRGPQTRDVDHLLKSADEAVYEAKRRGRNRVEVEGVEPRSDRRGRDRRAG